MKWQLLLSSAAAREYKNLDRQIMGPIKEKLRVIEQDPLSPDFSKALNGRPGLRAARTGNWRILYFATGGEINVVCIGHRREVYKNL